MTSEKKKLDSYSLLIASKYFICHQDYINIIQVCKKFRDTTEKFRFNPIRVYSHTLFPQINTQYLYTLYDHHLPDVNRFRHMYYVSYTYYLKHNNIVNEYNEFPYIELTTNDIQLVQHDEKIVIPKCIKKIGSSVFEDYLYEIRIPPKILELGENCFRGCTLSSLTIPTSVTKLGNSCFSNMNLLEEIILPETLPELPSDCFESCNSLKTLLIPNSITKICSSCFNNCGITFIELPSSVKVLERFSFFCCSQLEHIILSSSLDSLNHALFSSCTSLKSVGIPSEVTRIDYQCFRNCHSLSLLHLPNKLFFIGHEAFMNCVCLTSLVIPETIRHIGLDAFRNCSKLVQFKFPFDEYPFKISLSDHFLFRRFQLLSTRVTLSESDLMTLDKVYSTSHSTSLLLIPTTIRYFSPRLLPHSLPSLTLPSTIHSMPPYTFNDCEYLSSIILSTTLTSLPNNTFSHCMTLCNVELPPELRYLGDYCFFDCPKLSTLRLPSTVMFIGSFCFRDCTSLSSFSIPESVCSIGRFCFNNCISLTYFSIPKRFNSHYPFTVSYNEYLRLLNQNIQCSDVEFVNDDFSHHSIPTGIPLKVISWVIKNSSYLTIPSNLICLRNCNFLSASLTSLVIPSSVSKIDDYCFNELIHLKELYLPLSIIKFGDHCFDNCQTLTKIEMQNNLFKNVTVSYDAYLRFSVHNIFFPNVEYVLSDRKKYGDSPPPFARQLKLHYVDISSSHLVIPTTISRINTYSIQSTSQTLDHLLFISFPSTITKIASNTLQNITTLTEVNLVCGLKRIGEKAFYQCRYLQVIQVPSTVTKIGNNCFDGCKAISSLNLQNVTKFGHFACARCTQLSGVTLSSRLIHLPPFVFENCLSLRQLVIPPSLTSIHPTSFWNCPFYLN